MAESCDSTPAVERYLHVLRRRNPQLLRRHSVSDVQQIQNAPLPSRPYVASACRASPDVFLPPRLPREDSTQQKEEKDVLEVILAGGPVSPARSEPRSLPDRGHRLSPSPRSKTKSPGASCRFSCDVLQPKKRPLANSKRSEAEGASTTPSPRTPSSALGRAGLVLALGGPRSPLSGAASAPGGAAAALSSAREALANAASAAADPAPGGLAANAEMWGTLRSKQVQAKLLLQRPDEAMRDDAAVAATLRIAEESLELLTRLEEIAKNLGVRKGQLWRWLLPCNSDTSIGNPPSDYATAAAEMPLGSAELDGRLPASLRRGLVKGAVVLRQFIRVKVNDCADMNQACDSLRFLIDYLKSVLQPAAEEGVSAASFLKEL